MKNCIPDELFNRIEYPISETSDTTIDGLVQEIVYKIPKVHDVIIKKEIWHTICDFCWRTGALLEKKTGVSAVEIIPTHGEFMRIVGASDQDGKTTDFTFSDSLSSSGNLLVTFPTGTTSCSIVISVRPKFDNTDTTNGSWTPKVPQYLLTRYGECITHGALARLFIMTHEPWANVDLARMHAVAYNNDLNRISFGLITSGMRKHLLIDVEDFIIQGGSGNGNG